MKDNINKLEKKIFRLQAFCVIMVLGGGSILLMGFNSNKTKKFDEIDVKRINVKDDERSYSPSTRRAKSSPRLCRPYSLVQQIFC